jgi:hypothetical protein
VGARLVVHHRAFELLEADEFTYTFMENNRHSFVVADVAVALQAVARCIAGRACPWLTCPWNTSLLVAIMPRIWARNFGAVLSSCVFELRQLDVASRTTGREEDLRSALIEVDPVGSGTLGYVQLEAAFQKCRAPLVRHQMIAIFRHLTNKDRGSELRVHDLLRAVAAAA